MIVSSDAQDERSWQQSFRQTHPEKSLQNTAAYLYRVLTDVLVQIRIEQDAWYQQYHCLLKARLCFERSVPSRAFKELRKAAKLAASTQHHVVAYQAARMELTALADHGFPALNEQLLVDKQMRAKHTLQLLRQIHEHYSLYELLSLRLIKGGRKDNTEQNEQITDLVLSELALSTRGSQHQFEPRKLHLLFQSFFFIHTGDYRSALHIFNELTQLIEANESMWDYPPYDYLSALEGILDSLRSIGYYREMEGFVHKLSLLAERPYPEHFRNVATLTTAVYRLNMLLGAGRYDEAEQLILEDHDHTRHTAAIDGHEKQLEHDYFVALTWFLQKRWAKAGKALNTLNDRARQHPRHAVYRAGRLLHILLSYERDDLTYMEYEIRSYKRAFRKQGKAFKIEKLVFNTLTSDPKRRGNAWKAMVRKKTATKLAILKADKREHQLLKYFDVGNWLMEKLA